MSKVKPSWFPDSRLLSSLKITSQAASTLVIVVGCLVLFGWIRDIPTLKSVLPGLATMKANTAIAFILSGASLWLLQKKKQTNQRSHKFAQLGGFIVAVLGVLTLSQYLFGWNLGIDQLLFQEIPGAVSTSHPGRMAPNSALNFILLGLALVLLGQKTRRAYWYAQLLTLIATLVSWQPLLGYTYGFSFLSGIAFYTQMALHTVLTFIVLCFGILFVRPRQGLMRLVTSDSTGGFIARRLLVAAIAIPSVVGYLIAQGYQGKLYNTPFGLSLLVMVNIVFFTVLIWQNAQTLDRIDRDRQQASSALEKLASELEQRVEERTAELRQANTALQEQIVERQQTEEKLHARQQELKALLENTPDVIIRCDRNLRYVYVNPAVERNAGVAASALIGKTSRDLGISEELSWLWETTLRKVFETGTEQTIEFQTATALGQRHYQSRVVPEFDRNNSIQYALIVSRDITELKAAEAALRQSESTLRSYFELPLIGIAITSPDGGWLDVNDKLCDILGYSRQELTQMKWSELTYPEDLEADLEQFNQVLAGHSEGFSMDKRFIRKNGEVFHGGFSTRCVRKMDGSIDYFVALFQDLSDRKRAEEERAQLIREQAARQEAEVAQQRAAFLAEVSAVLADSLDYETTLKSVANLAVPFMADWCAVDLVEADGTTRQLAVAHIDPAKVELAKELQRRYPRDPNALHGVLHVIRTGEPEFCAEIPDSLLLASAHDAEHLQLLQELKLKSYIVMPLILRERVLGTMSFVFAESGRSYKADDLVLGEELARRAAVAIDNARAHRESQEANRMKDEFLATLSHELRSPLNAMLGWTKLLLTRKFDEATTKKAIETIERNARSQAQLIEDLLDISRIIRGQLRLSVRPVELVPSIEAAIDTVRPAAEAKAIQILPMPTRESTRILGDPDRLQQLIWNLLSNAIKFTPKGGRVELRLKHVDAHVELAISDTGQGISPDFLPYVFDRFRQADSSITRVYGGLGLGLAIVRQLVELHGGTVKAESPGVGQGATFIVQLPLLTDSPSANDLKPKDSTAEGGVPSHCLANLKGLRILVVDDETDARELLTRILEECGAEVVAVASAAEAIRVLTEFSTLPVDVLVSDIGMPNQDGYALLQRVRALDAQSGRQIPAVALTAYAREEDRQAALLAGFQSHVTKPVEPAKLIKEILNLAGRTEQV